MDLDTLCSRLDDELNTASYADIDGSPNGLQVERSDRDVEHVAFAVDAAQATIDDAVAAGADLLVTHHGLWWEGTARLTGYDYERVATLIDGDVGLYVSHLPLDGHPELGNAAGIADTLGLVDRDPFGEYKTEYVGQQGRFEGPQTVEGVVDQLTAELEGDRPVDAFPFGPDEVDEVGIVTGAGVDYLEPAAEAGLDLLITGEGKQSAYHVAREIGMNLILAGHYATETAGVQALQGLVDGWGLETTYLSHPTRL